MVIWTRRGWDRVRKPCLVPFSSHTNLSASLVPNLCAPYRDRSRENKLFLFCIPDFTATFICHDSMEMFADGKNLGKHIGRRPKIFNVPGNTRVISVKAETSGHHRGILGSFSNGLVTNARWKCSDVRNPGSRWNTPDFDDKKWLAAEEIAKRGDPRWKKPPGIAPTAKWIWSASKEFDIIYCRLNLP